MKIKKKENKILFAKKNLLSVIVPTYKCHSIDKDLKGIEKYLRELNVPYELICVLDGTIDENKRTKNYALKAKSQTIRVVGYKNNRGKGYAVRYGMARAKGDIIAFIDAGNDLNASGLGLALEHMKWYDADIIIGSKRHRASKVNYPFKRRLLSFLVQNATKFVFGINVTDTQTGLKVFRREVLEDVLPRLLVKKWAFDLEILTVANRLGYSRIYESPVEINFNNISNVGIKSIRSFINDYLAIIYRLYILRYYDDDNIDIWEDDKRLKLRYRLDKNKKLNVKNKN